MQDMNWDQIKELLLSKGLREVPARHSNSRKAPGFEFEADWCYNGTGYGVADRWLITSVGTESIGSGAERWLLAYEINADGAKTGRVVLLCGPISDEDDSRLLEEAASSIWWYGGHPSLDQLDGFLRSDQNN